MNRKEFIEYVRGNYNAPAEALRIIDNSILYAEAMLSSEEERFDFLNFILVGTIGISEQEIRKIDLK